MTEKQFGTLKNGDRVVWFGVGDEEEQPGKILRITMEDIGDGEERVLDIECDDGVTFPVRVSDCELLRKES